MKKVLFLLPIILLSSCNSLPDNSLSIEISANNYDKFFTTQDNSITENTIVEPLYNKHLDYSNVVFTFETTYGHSRYSQTQTYDFSISLDDAGKGTARYLPKNEDATVHETIIKSVSGVVSFQKNYSKCTKITTKTGKESLAAYMIPKGLKFYCNPSFTNDSSTDAFYLVESVEISFTTQVNNVEKELTYIVHPDLIGYAFIEIEELFQSQLTAKSYRYINSYYIEY